MSILPSVHLPACSRSSTVEPIWTKFRLVVSSGPKVPQFQPYPEIPCCLMNAINSMVLVLRCCLQLPTFCLLSPSFPLASHDAHHPAGIVPSLTSRWKKCSSNLGNMPSLGLADDLCTLVSGWTVKRGNVFTTMPKITVVLPNCHIYPVIKFNLNWFKNEKTRRSSGPQWDQIMEHL